MIRFKYLPIEKLKKGDKVIIYIKPYTYSGSFHFKGYKYQGTIESIDKIYVTFKEIGSEQVAS